MTANCDRPAAESGAPVLRRKTASQVGHTCCASVLLTANKLSSKCSSWPGLFWGFFFVSCCHSLALAQIHHLEFASRSKNTTRVQMTFSCLERGRQRRPQLNKTRWLEIRGETRRLLLPRREALMPRRNNLHQKIQWKFENYVTFSAASRSSETSQKRLLSAAVLKRCFSRRLRSRQCFRL